MQNSNEQMLSGPQIALKTGIPLRRIVESIKSGKLNPDASVMDGRIALFSVARVEELKRQFGTVGGLAR